MEDSIRNFPKQFSLELSLENADRLPKKKRFVLGGMGGSHLCASLYNTLRPEVPLLIHKNYGLPTLPEEDRKETLFIASSFSGETEETLSFAEEVIKQGLSLAVIAERGPLLSLAKQNSIPCIDIPDLPIEPRQASPVFLLALCILLQDKNLEEELRKTGPTIDPEILREEGKVIAEGLRGKTPLLYGSIENRALLQNWKVKLNETAKSPCFFNVFPELNHNEMEGFGGDALDKFHFILFLDEEDQSRIKKRMRIFENLFSTRGFSFSKMELSGQTRMEKILRTILLGEWVAFFLAEKNGILSHDTPLIREFKEKLRE